MAGLVFFISLICLLLAVSHSLAQASLQYCHGSPNTPGGLCVVVEAWQNTTASSTDLIATFGHQRYARDTGWTAFGLGNGMVGALMFIAYAAEGNSSFTYQVMYREISRELTPRLYLFI